MNTSITFTSISTEKDVTSVTFNLLKDNVIEKGFVSFIGNIGTIDPWTFIPTRKHTFEIVSCSSNCPDLNNHIKVEGEKYNRSFNYLLEKIRELPKDYLQKPIDVFSYSPMTDKQSKTTMPSWCNAKIVFKAYHRKVDQHNGWYFSNVLFDLIRNDGHIHHCTFGFSLNGDNGTYHAGNIENNTYLHDILPDLYNPNFKLFNPKNGNIESWRGEILERIVSSVDSKLLERQKREEISIFESLKLTEEDCNLTYYCEIYPEESNHSHRNPEYYMANYNNACK